jgi:hypothetical protein
MGLAIGLFAVVVVAILIYAVDKHLSIQEIEADLKNYLGEAEAAAKIAEGNVKTHYNAVVITIEAIISKHFKL